MAPLTPWSIACAVLFVALVPLVLLAATRSVLNAVVTVELASGLAVMAILALAYTSGRPTLVDVALALALLSLPSALVFTHLVERWL